MALLKAACKRHKQNHPSQVEIKAGDLRQARLQLPHTKRKTWAVYFSFTEFGQATLSKEDASITLMIKRSSEVSALEASMGQCFRPILEHMFTSEWGSPCHGVL